MNTNKYEENVPTAVPDDPSLVAAVRRLQIQMEEAQRLIQRLGEQVATLETMIEPNEVNRQLGLKLDGEGRRR